MRTFVKHNKDGDIISVCRTEVVPENMETPFGALQDGEFVIEIHEDDAMKKLKLEDIHDNHRIDRAKKQIVKKTKQSKTAKP